MVQNMIIILKNVVVDKRMKQLFASVMIDLSYGPYLPRTKDKSCPMRYSHMIITFMQFFNIQ